MQQWKSWWRSNRAGIVVDLILLSLLIAAFTRLATAFAAIDFS